MDYQEIPDVIVYHGNCQDGFTGAWVAWRKFGNQPQYIPAYHDPKQIPPPETFEGKAVMFIDFTWKWPVMTAIAEFAKSIVILDHHESAAEDLSRFPDFIVGWPGSFKRAWDCAVSESDRLNNQLCPIVAGFDMKRSGAMLAWHFLHGDENVPLLVSIVQDRDLWRFELSNTKEISMWLFSFDYDFKTWSDCASILEIDKGTAIAAGAAIMRKFDKDLKELLPQVTTTATIAGHTVPMANLPYFFASEGGNLLAELNPDAPFAATYYLDANGNAKFSLRSRKQGGANVAKIASMFGGGGHPNASGFTYRWRLIPAEINP